MTKRAGQLLSLGYKFDSRLGYLSASAAGANNAGGRSMEFSAGGGAVVTETSRWLYVRTRNGAKTTETGLKSLLPSISILLVNVKPVLDRRQGIIRRRKLDEPTPGSLCAEAVRTSAASLSPSLPPPPPTTPLGFPLPPQLTPISSSPF